MMPATVISEDIQFKSAGSEGNNMVQCTVQTVTLPQGNYQSLQFMVLATGGVNVESGTFQSTIPIVRTVRRLWAFAIGLPKR